TVLPKVVPTFNALPPLCQNSPAPVLPQFSTNVPPIAGTWNDEISTSVVGTRTYTFTPDPGQCAVSTPVTLAVMVMAGSTPDFPPIAPFCANSAPPVLPWASPNGITGTWTPAVVSASDPGTYVFNPDPGQCASTQILTSTVIPNALPLFDSIAPFCEGSLAPVLPTVSNNGIAGAWTPAVVSNLSGGSYVFTPDSDICAASATMYIDVLAPIDPGFINIALCSGNEVPLLPSVSPLGISGTWAPPVIDGTIGGTYVFTPNEGECAVQQ